MRVCMLVTLTFDLDYQIIRLLNGFLFYFEYVDAHLQLFLLL